MVLDIIVVALVVVFALSGKKRGIVNTLLQAVSTVLSIIVAFVIKEPVTEFLKKTDLYEKTTVSLAEKIAPEITFGTDKGLWGNIANRILEESSAVTDIAETSAEYITNAVIGIIITLIVFIAAFAIIKVFSKVVNGIFRLPGLNIINKVLGMAWGAALALFVVYLVLAIGSVSFLENSLFFKEQIATSALTKYLYENNLLINIFM